MSKSIWKSGSDGWPDPAFGYFESTNMPDRSVSSKETWFKVLKPPELPEGRVTTVTCGRRTLCLLVVGLIAGCSQQENAPKPASQNPSPMVETTREHERINEEQLPGTRFELTVLDSTRIPLFLPDHARQADSVRLLVHFHGSAFIPERAAFDAHQWSAVAAVHLGSGSRVYERAFDDPSTFRKLVRSAEDSLLSTGVNAVTEVVLTAFSAGYGAVRAILNDPDARVDGVVLLDGLHTDYIPEATPLFDGGQLNVRKLDPFVVFARSAMNGSGQMLITHSEIFPGTFASTTETTDHIIERLDLTRDPVLRWGPVGMQQLSEIRSGNLLILGFAGNTAPDHVDHFHAMPALLDSLK